ncbi:sulfotransferase [Mesorhizobium sp. M0187]|uniref:sulfotransferase n=1 Tax=Mesorhizobium sp. M0187 TaxID=2956908 RepID=UPI0033370B32
MDDLATRLAGRVRRATWLDLIGASFLFNAEWYLDHYPDVRDAGVDPALHYLVHGGIENRDPSPSFSTSWYLDTYEDVRTARINPLLHYLLHGRFEGRIFATHLKAINDLLTISQKVFVIGRNKTGTTSLAAALGMVGYRIGSQHQAEGLLDDWHRRDFRALIDYCHSADAFQDVPFSLPSTYRALDIAFPGAKFILTVRDSADQWYKSVTTFHSHLIGVDRQPTPADLKQFGYHEPGWLWRQQLYVYGINEASLYDPEIYKAHYLKHNADVIEHFNGRPHSLLVLNLSRDTAAAELARFLGIGQLGMTIPHLNATPRPLRDDKA